MDRLLNTSHFKDVSTARRNKKTIFYFMNVLYEQKCQVHSLKYTRLAAKMVTLQSGVFGGNFFFF